MKLINLLCEEISITTDSPIEDEGVFTYYILNNGEQIGYMLVSIMNNDCRIEYISGELGVTALRSILKQLKRNHRFSSVSGNRLSGAYHDSGKADRQRKI